MVQVCWMCKKKFVKISASLEQITQLPVSKNGLIPEVLLDGEHLMIRGCGGVTVFSRIE